MLSPEFACGKNLAKLCKWTKVNFEPCEYATKWLSPFGHFESETTKNKYTSVCSRKVKSGCKYSTWLESRCSREALEHNSKRYTKNYSIIRFERVNFRNKNKTAFLNNRGGFFPQVLNLLAARTSAGTIIQMEKTLCRHKNETYSIAF